MYIYIYILYIVHIYIHDHSRHFYWVEFLLIKPISQPSWMAWWLDSKRKLGSEQKLVEWRLEDWVKTRRSLEKSANDDDLIVDFGWFVDECSIMGSLILDDWWWFIASGDFTYEPVWSELLYQVSLLLLMSVFHHFCCCHYVLTFLWQNYYI